MLWETHRFFSFSFLKRKGRAAIVFAIAARPCLLIREDLLP